jgi:type II secretory pathway pseudopilin PulG
MIRLSQAGDTIIEVLICIGIVSMILGGAFVTTRASQTGVRNSQEHGEALKLAESQLEQLRADASSASPTVFTQGTPFCMYGNTAVSTHGSTAKDCVQDSGGNPTSGQPAYQLSVDRVASNGGYLFTTTVQWYQANGNGKATESMVYRLYN